MLQNTTHMVPLSTSGSFKTSSGILKIIALLVIAASVLLVYEVNRVEMPIDPESAVTLYGP